jgi:ribosomal protein S18 acetylase RimI-like enzyme
VNYKVRPMNIADKPDVMALLKTTPEFEAAEIPVAEEVIDVYLDCPGRDYRITVAEMEFKVAGYVCFGQTPLTLTTWDVYWMAVSMEKRGIGLGAGLIKNAEDAIQKAGGKLILIETSSKPNYLNTRRFYVKKGYQRVSRIRDFYAPGDHRIIFEKRFQ